MINIEKYGYEYTFIFDSEEDIQSFIYSLNQQSDLICIMNNSRFTVKFVKSNESTFGVFKKHYIILYLDSEDISDISELLQIQEDSFVLDTFFEVKTIKNKTVTFYAYRK